MLSYWKEVGKTPLQKNDKFGFWLPLEKAGEETVKGQKVPIVQGIASNEDPDVQNEEIIQKGMDFTPFLETGYINWDHKDRDGPENIIGEPIEAKIIKGPSFWIKGFLYPDVPRAQAVMNLLKDQELMKSNRRLGWSVQGYKVLKVGDKVVKSIVEHVAITHQPVNTGTWVELIKSMTTAEAKPLELQDLGDNLTTLLNPCDKCKFNGKVFNDGGERAFKHLTKCHGISEEDAYNFLIKLYKKFHSGKEQ